MAKIDKQIVSKKRGNPNWQKGVSGNPQGCPVDPHRREANDLLKANAPAVAQKALDLVLCAKPDTTVLNALIKKIFPDNIKIEGELAINTLAGLKGILKG